MANPRGRANTYIPFRFSTMYVDRFVALRFAQKKNLQHVRSPPSGGILTTELYFGAIRKAEIHEVLAVREFR